MVKKEARIVEQYLWKKLLVWAIPFLIILYGLYLISQANCSTTLLIPMGIIVIGTAWLMLRVYLIIKNVYR